MPVTEWGDEGGGRKVRDGSMHVQERGEVETASGRGDGERRREGKPEWYILCWEQLALQYF